ncbi:MAG: hypothetical protein R2850_04075 [Bacteroidia bacterium]
MSTGNQIPEELIARYLAGEAGSVEKRELESWAAESEENAAILAATRKVWGLTAHVDLPETDTNAARNKLKLRMQEASSGKKHRLFRLVNRTEQQSPANCRFCSGRYRNCIDSFADA